MSARPRPEALLYALLASAGLGPVVAHTLWRPLTSLLAVEHAGLALHVSIGAAVVGALATLAGLGPRPAPTRAGIAVLAAIAGFVIGGVPATLALLATAGAVLAAAPRVLRDFPPTPAWSGRRRLAALVVGALFAVLAVPLIVGLSAFMADPALIRFALPPGADFYHDHYCMTAYAHAAELVRAGVFDVYDPALRPPGAAAADVPTAAHMAPFMLDSYGYPPQFLLVPLALSAALPEFGAQRAAWFGVNGLAFAYALWTLAVWVGPRGGRVALLGAPILWVAMLVPLQSGNAHLLVMTLAVLGMRAFGDRRAAPADPGDSRRPLLGGALLASATLAKISPGLLGVVLLVRRRWRAAGWTVLWAILISALALAVVGRGPFEAFIEGHLPRISSGEAYDFLDDRALTLVSNWSPFALAFKLRAMGLDLDPWRWAPRIGAIFTALAFVLAALGARRGGDRRSMAALWLAVLTLAALRSPMAPPYTVATAFWACLMLAAEPGGAGRRLGYVGAFGLLTVPMMLLMLRGPGASGVAALILSCAAIVALVTLLAWMMLRRWPPLDG